MPTPSRGRTARCILAIAGFILLSGAPASPAQTTRWASETTSLNNVEIHGSLDLANGVPIRWKKPDGSGYINIFVLDKNGTLRLCNDPYFYQSNDIDHLFNKVIEVRNPASQYADFRLPFSRTNNINADSKLVLRSLNWSRPTTHPNSTSCAPAPTTPRRRTTTARWPTARSLA
jgi:hypothetical protein